MELSDLTIRILLLFFPGIICYVIVDALTVHQPRKPFQFVLFSYVLGVLCYVIYGALCKLAAAIADHYTWDTTYIPSGDGFLSALTVDGQKLDFAEIGCVTVLAFVVAFVFAAASNHKLLYRFAGAISVTKQFGDENVWSFVFNANEFEWVHVRDLKNGLVYEGWVNAFSDVDRTPSLLLMDVVVYRNNAPDVIGPAQELYRVPALYVSRKQEEFTIEFVSRRAPRAAWWKIWRWRLWKFWKWELWRWRHWERAKFWRLTIWRFDFGPYLKFWTWKAWQAWVAEPLKSFKAKLGKRFQRPKVPPESQNENPPLTSEGASPMIPRQDTPQSHGERHDEQ
ncbi:MAG TPA: DUF6338 family protein [Pirellulales bacterium]|nr:DUF6338 family protein [Pirellulales bacterium]